MRFKGVIGWLILLLVLVAGVYFWIRHGVDAAIQNVTSNRALIAGTKSAAASLAVAGEKPEAEGSAYPQLRKGALDSYAQNPKKAEADAQLTDTWASGLVISDALLTSNQPKPSVGSSDDIAGLDSKFRVDGWGHRFCYSLQQNMAIIFSVGNSGGAPDCQKWQAPTNTAGLPRERLVKMTDGGFLLIVVR